MRTPPLTSCPGSLPGCQTLSLLDSVLPASAEGVCGAGVLRQLGKAQNVKSCALTGSSGVSAGASGSASGRRLVSFLAPHPKSLLDA